MEVIFIHQWVENELEIPSGFETRSVCHGDCTYTVLQTVQMHGVFSANHILKSFDIKVGHNPDFGGFLLWRYYPSLQEAV